ncbi:hypothetical protein Taro_050451 [Colocasia esculenta]|uniref:CCHC-type domain-containing protein n=1 Tax=Colocasia esculenta TaxID=4460 RepID=A0A843XDH0_COLES|nr:hypothetical protein [Colocasia esculenta]
MTKGEDGKSTPMEGQPINSMNYQSRRPKKRLNKDKGHLKNKKHKRGDQSHNAIQPFKEKCWHCSRMGHKAEECWRKAGACLRCGSKDHQISVCPQLEKKAPQRQASTPWTPTLIPASNDVDANFSDLHALQSPEFREQATPTIGELSPTEQTFLCKRCVDTPINGVDTSTQIQREIGTQVDTLPGQVDIRPSSQNS